MEMQPDLLGEIHEELNYEAVSTGTRFVNYLIDLVVYYILSFTSAYIFAAVLPLDNQVLALGFSYVVYLFYFTFMEGATGGRTVGKIITGSKAVKEDGDTFTWNDALMRSLSRMVPFEPFSALDGHPWHDRWTKTKVVKSKSSLD